MCYLTGPTCIDHILHLTIVYTNDSRMAFPTPQDIVALHLLSAKIRKRAAVSLQYVIANGHAGSQWQQHILINSFILYKLI